MALRRLIPFSPIIGPLSTVAFGLLCFGSFFRGKFPELLASKQVPSNGAGLDSLGKHLSSRLGAKHALNGKPAIAFVQVRDRRDELFGRLRSVNVNEPADRAHLQFCVSILAEILKQLSALPLPSVGAEYADGDVAIPGLHRLVVGHFDGKLERP